MALALVAIIVAAGPAWGETVTIEKPAILGPGGHVEEISASGETRPFFCTETRGIERPEMNAALWEADFAGGDARVEVWIPREFGFTWARYHLQAGSLTTEVRLRQGNAGGEWVVLGAFALPSGPVSIRSTDAAGYPGEGVCWAALRLTSVPSLPPNAETVEGSTIVDEPQVAASEEDVVRFADVGWGGQMYRAYAQGTERPSLASATWTVSVTPGPYELSAYVPAEHAQATTPFTVDAATGPVTFQLHEGTYNDAWVALGDVELGDTATVTSTDQAGVLGEEIGWSAIKLRPLAQPAPPPAPGGPPTGPGGSSAVGPPVTAAAGVSASETSVLPLVPTQLRLVSFDVFRARSGRVFTFEATGLHPTTKGIELTYACAPCLFVRARDGLANKPVRSYATGPARAIVGRRLAAASVLEINIGATGRRPRRYIYRFSGDGSIHKSSCLPADGASAASAAGKPEPRCR